MDPAGEAIARAKNRSDMLLMFPLKASRPAVYREKQIITVTPLVRQAEAIRDVFRAELPPDLARLVTPSYWKGLRRLTQQQNVNGTDHNFSALRVASDWKHSFTKASYFFAGVEYLRISRTARTTA
jgi:hypothetical protein